MRKNGFTFIEILGVITLLALLSIIILTVVDKNLKDSKDTLSEVQIENIKSAASMWRTDNIELVPESGYYILTLNDLINTGYIDEIIDPNSKNGYDKNILVDISMNDILVGNAADNYIASTYGCNNSTVFCIKDRSDMEKLAKEVIGGDNKSGKTYKLIKNIDLGGKFDSDGNPLEGNTSWTPIGSEAKPFSGTFDGTGHIITGMYIDSTSDNTGLFSVVDGGTIKNMGIEDSYVKSNNENTGVFVGRIINESTISSCYNASTVFGGKASGGLVGRNTDGNIENCYNIGTIISANTQFVGGIVGVSNPSSVSIIENCYNAGIINSTSSENGGIAGGGGAHIRQTYNVGYLKGRQGVAGISGHLNSVGIIENSYSSGNLETIVYNSIGGILANMYTNSSQQLINNYYLNTTADYGIFHSDNENYASQSDNNATPLSAGEMPSVISVINGDGAFVPDTKGINNGYPILKWQQR